MTAKYGTKYTDPKSKSEIAQFIQLVTRLSLSFFSSFADLGSTI